MKKIGLILMSILILVGCNMSSNKIAKITYDSAAVLEAVKADMSGYDNLKDADHVFLEVVGDEILKVFTEKGSGVFYLGYIFCPWCNRAVPVLNETAKEAEINVYYYDVSKEENQAAMQELIDLYLVDSLDDGALYVPFVMVVKNGEVVAHHTSLVESYQDYTKSISDKQKEELMTIYYEMFKKLP